MSLELWLGPSASGKTEALLQRLASLSKEEGGRIYYLVPEQLTMKASQRLLGKVGATVRVQVLSFERLAHQLSPTSLTMLDDMGKCMLLSKIAREHEKELVHYAGSARKPGFIEQMKLMITEIIQYGLTEEKLLELSGEAEEGSLLSAKLKDIALLWHHYAAYIEEKALSSESALDMLAKEIGSSGVLKDAEIIIDGFTGFTPQQYKVIQAMLQKASRVSVALTITEEAFREAREASSWREIPRDLFFAVQKTVWKLTELCRDLQMPYRENWLSEEHRSEELSEVSKRICFLRKRPYEKKASAFRAFEGDKAADEYRRVFRGIAYLVREKGYAYRDIAVLCADLQGDEKLIQRLCGLYKIPHFIDHKVSIGHNPYVRFLEALLSLLSKGWRREDLLALLRTRLTGLEPDLIDRLENRLIEFNAHGRKALLERLESFSEEAGEEEKESLYEFLRPLSHLIEDAKEAETAADYAAAVRAFAEGLSVKERLEDMAELLAGTEDGRMLSRIYEVAEELMTQLERVLGSSRTSAREFEELIGMGLGQLRLSQVPPALDEVLFGDLKKTKLSSVRVLFITGLTGEAFPGTTEGGSLLSSQEREAAGKKLELAQGDKEKISESYLQLYLAMGKARERIFLSRRREKNDGSVCAPSAIWKYAEQILGEGGMLAGKKEPYEPVLALLYEDPAAVEGLIREGVLERWEAEDADAFLAVKEAAEESGGKAGHLEEASSRKLLDPRVRRMSVTGIQTYELCPFRYFLTYGLRLRERREPKLRRLDDGNMLHELLKEAGDLLACRLSEEEALEKARELSQKISADYEVYQSTARYRYYWEKLQRTAARALKILTEQNERSSFRQMQAEWPFGGREGGAEQALTIDLPKIGSVSLQGQIDRIDVFESDNKRYMQILDYKSGGTTYDLKKVYDGVQLQLPVYAMAAKRYFNTEVAGIFYFHLRIKAVVGKNGLLTGEEQLTMERLKHAKLDGTFLNDPGLMREMDLTLKDNFGHSTLITGSRLLKSGKLQDSDRALSEAAMEGLQALARERIAEAGSGMLEGRVERRPYKDHDSSCGFCDYKAACPFEGKRTSDYRPQTELSKKEIVEIMEEKA